MNRLPPLTLSATTEAGKSITTFYDVRRVMLFAPTDNRKSGDIIKITDGSVLNGEEGFWATADNLKALKAWQAKVAAL